MAFTYHSKFKAFLNPDTWENPTIDLENCTDKDITGYILHRKECYKESGYKDTVLWEYFKDDFEGWQKKTWERGHKDAVRDMRDFLREYGVFAARHRGSIAANLQQVLDEDNELNWTEEEVAKQIANGGKLVSRWNPNNTPAATRLTSVASTASPFNHFTTENIVQNTQPARTLEVPQSQKLSVADSTANSTAPSATAPLSLVPPQREQFPPPSPLPSQPFSFAQSPAPLSGVSKLLTEPTKLYSEEMKFGGELYDVLNTKLCIFEDCCRKVVLVDSTTIVWQENG
jgi:hypothetical protein